MANLLDKAVQERFKRFRKKYVSNNGRTAAELLNTDQSTISKIENGERKVSDKILTAMIKKFNLNREWLLDGTGAPVAHEKQAKPINYLEALSNRIDALTTEVKILDSNLNQAWKIIEAQGKLIEKLQNEVSRG